jgi:histone H3/H4
MSSPQDDPLERAARRAAARLRPIDTRPFSEPAFQLVEASIADYIRSLVLESSRIAEFEDADVISASDVERASRYLFRSSGRSLAQHIGTAGGILLGAALGNTLSLVSAKHPSHLSFALTIGLAIAGAFMIAFHIARDTR